MTAGQAVTEAEILAVLAGGSLQLDMLWEDLGVADDPQLAVESMGRLSWAGKIRHVGCKHDQHDRSCVVELAGGAR